jgi:hypothetical protein
MWQWIFSGIDGQPVRAVWAACFKTAETAALHDLLEKGLRARTWLAPFTQVGIVLRARPSVTELFEIGDLHQLATSSISSEFLGFAVADPGGKPTTEVARDLMRQLFDYTLHLERFDASLAALGRDPSKRQS